MSDYAEKWREKIAARNNPVNDGWAISYVRHGDSRFIVEVTFMGPDTRRVAALSISGARELAADLIDAADSAQEAVDRYIEERYE